MPTVVLFKIITAPLLILGLTLLVRRFGPIVGGLAMGIPLVTGPISVFTVLEHGADFARHAAVTNLVGQVSGCVFCFAYAHAAMRFRSWSSAASGIAAFLVATLVWSRVDWTLPYAITLLILGLGLLALAIPEKHAPAAPWWDLPMRMVVASCFVLAITSLSGHLGAQLSGLLAPFPVFVLILAVFTHLHHGGAAAAKMMRGVILGSPAFGAFFVVVAVGLLRLPVAATYVCATLVSLLVSGCGYLLLRRPTRR
jgi:hypothetical protein